MSQQNRDGVSSLTAASLLQPMPAHRSHRHIFCMALAHLGVPDSVLRSKEEMISQAPRYGSLCLFEPVQCNIDLLITYIQSLDPIAGASFTVERRLIDLSCSFITFQQEVVKVCHVPGNTLCKLDIATDAYKEVWPRLG